MVLSPVIAAGRTFQPFGPDHLAALGAITLLSAVLIVIARRSGPVARRRLACGVGVILAAQVLAQTPYEIAVGAWQLIESLPLHLCDIALLAAIAALFCAARDSRPPWSAANAASARRAANDREPRRNPPSTPRAAAQVTYELAWFWGLAGTLQALLTPSVFETFPDPLYLFYFVAHGGILLAALLLTLGCGWRPRPGSPWRALSITYALVPPVAAVDWLIGANYMYLCGPPPAPSLYDYFGPWPWSVLTLAVIAVVMFWACYAPFAISGLIRRQETSAQNSDAA